MEDEHLPEVDAALLAADVMMGVAARSVLDVEDLVTSPQLRVLVTIATHGPRNLGEIAAELGVHASNATRTCDKIVRAGLLARSEDPADRRFVRLSLTKAGTALVERVITHRRTALAEVFAAMPADERDAAANGFRAFARAAGVRGDADGRFTLMTPA